MRLNAKQIAACTGGEFVVDPLDPRRLCCGVTWDSREVAVDDLYVALPGERVDGHSFVAAALATGAACALVMQPLDESTLVLAREMGAGIIEVPDTAHAVTDLAREWRGHLKGRVVGITGSTGKTTTKNLVRDVLAAGMSVVATCGNQNNELGVPRTVLAADPETQAVVVEMGMRGAGQIAELCEFVRPEWGLVTNAGESHIELLGSRENIARAKGELVASLPQGTGVAFVNNACDMTDFMWEESGQEGRIAQVRFDGSGHGGERLVSHAVCGDVPAVWAEDVRLDDQGRPTFTLAACGFAGAEVERASCSLTLRGMHNVSNACSAAAVGLRFGMSLTAVAAALGASEPAPGRQEVVAARGGFTVVNDAYNANPDSMRASLTTFCALDVPGRRYAVLGDMAELGSYAEACHRGIGEVAAGLPLDFLLCVGELARGIAEAACAAGMPPERVACTDSVAGALAELETRVEPGDAVLVKASNCMGLSRVVEGLVN